jgi:hypothetical protein
VVRKIERIVQSQGRHLTGGQVYATLVRDADGRDPGVSKRTVERIVDDLYASDASGPWSMDDPDTSGAEMYVLEVVRALIDDQGSHATPVLRPSRSAAAWIARLRRAYPDWTNDPWRVWRAATMAVRGGEHLAAVETFLAYTPWRDDAEGLARAIDRQIVGFDVAFAFAAEGDIQPHLTRWHIERKENKQ